MASLRVLQGEIMEVCGGNIGLGSSCMQRILIDAVNLAFLLTYCISLLITNLMRSYSIERRVRNWLHLVVSAFCTAVGITHLALLSWKIFSEDRRFMAWDSAICLVRGLVWVIIAVSLNLRSSKCTRILVSIWWISFTLLISALNIKILVQDHALQILDMATWPVNFMLLVCGIRFLYHLYHDSSSNNEIMEPLLTAEKDATRRTGLSSASFIGKMTFSWLNPLLHLGYSTRLNLRDIPELASEDDAALAYQAFSHAWDFQRKHTNKVTNLAIFALARCYKKEMVLVGLYAIMKTVSVAALPLLLFEFVQYSNRKKQNFHEGLFLVGCLVLAKTVESLSQRHWFFDSRRFGMRMRSALTVAVYQKLLKLSSLGRRKHTNGEIVNYIAVDAYRLGEFPWWFHMAWSLPLQMIFSVVILFSVAGIGAILGLIPLFICATFNIPMAKILQNCQYQIMVAQDERIRAMSEILNSMKIIKLQSWEEHFRRAIQSFREVEFKWLKNVQIKKSFGTGLYWMSPTLVSAMVFTGCALMRSAPLNASTIFTVLSTLRVMSEPVRFLPEVLSMMIQVKVSLDRLDMFLIENEIENNEIKGKSLPGPDPYVGIQNGEFSWDFNEKNLTLKGINLKITEGQKVAVCGPVGSGKSSILFAILGEIPRISGSVDAYGSIAYVSQTSWIQSGTVRDNILYGKSMDKGRYEMAIKACALDKDINNFRHGDLTEIGQRGLNMSGGQKQRIQLARAVYSDADLYLLDDPFSAVDAHTAAILFNDCVMDALLDKTVILVTHQIEFLTEMDKILVMENGQVTQVGSYEDILKSGTAFEQLVDAHESAITAIDNTNYKTQEENPKVSLQLVTTGIKHAKQQSQGDTSANGTSTVQLTEEEDREMGYGGWKPYIDYICISKNYLYLSSIALAQFAFVVFQMTSTYWLAVAVEIPRIGPGILIGAYTILSALSCFFVCLRSFLAANLGLKASKVFFSGFLDSVFKAPMLFFDSTPVGRILTRASSDMSIVDFDLPFAISFVIAVAIEVSGITVLMATVTWQILVAAIPTFIAMLYIQRYYIISARELVRINGTTKAPIMNYAAETSLGVVTIRAFAATERFIQNNIKLINTDAMLFFHTIASMEWVLIRVEALQNLTILTAAILIIMLPQNTVAPGFVGLSLSYALTLTTAQGFFTRWFSSLDNYIISVERIKQFMYLPPEAPATINDKRPPSSWPYEGNIDFQNLKIRYRPNAPLVLNGITCTFAAGEKIGVVGRTGSGKTTLISALFRLVEPAGGRILIDKLDICSIGLKDLRMKLSIIPQEPTLFQGNVRKNLDPLGLHSDHEIWKALDKCQLKSTISNLPNLLDSTISDEGENWSVGQRQLFCLGRVLLRRNRILVLDEATASIDSATDAVLQKIIREEFSNCTVVMVAHRVPTVMDSDMVMVLSYGNLEEYDKPSNLMGMGSSFAKLVAEYWSNCKRKSTQDFRNL